MSLPRVTLFLLLAALAPLACGCMERVDADLKVAAGAAEQASKWEAAGSFGGDAVETVSSADPWEVRFAPDGFVRISGVCATGGEVWVADLGISRIQVFGEDGTFKRSYGRGMPLRGTMLTDKEFLRDYDQHRRRKDGWEGHGGAVWIGAEAELFMAADVTVSQQGFYIADWAKSSGTTQADRTPGIVLHHFDGTPPTRFPSINSGWPHYVDFENGLIVTSDALLNTVYMNTPNESPQLKVFGTPASFDNMLRAKEQAQDPRQLIQALYGAGQASGEPGKFYNPGGLVVAYDKLIVCDTGNRRIQIFETRKDDEFYYGRLLRVVTAQDSRGHVRFEEPRDIDIAPDGRMYILDTVRQEVVELSPTFERLGVVAKGFGNAYAIDLTDDGRGLFVTDRGDNSVHHYVRVD
jgi:hypothetical protein